MNWAEIDNEWPNAKLLLKAYWPNLSHDDLAFIDHSRDRLVEILQSRYHLNNSEAELAVCNFEKQVRKPGASA